MINLIQPITVQQAYDGITHTRRWASWNWWWRKVDDDDGDGFPSPEPRTDSRSALPRKNRAWWRLRIVKRDESFSLIVSPRKWIYGVKVEWYVSNVSTFPNTVALVLDSNLHDLMALTRTDAVFSRLSMVLFMCRNKSSRNDLKLHGDYVWK